MARITALRKAGRTGVAVELDGEPWRRLPQPVVLACRLRPGLELDRLRLRRLRAELRRFEALEVAAKLLRHRDLASERLESELARRHVAPVNRHEALRILERAGVVDDVRLAIRRAQTLAGQGYGDEAVRWRLAQAGLPAPCVEEALASLDPERVRAQAVVEREGLSARTARLLARRGFGEDTVEAACRSAAGTDESALG